MMDDLVAFLNARYDEDEARAKGHGPRVVVYGKNGRPVPPVPAFTGGYSARRVLAEVAAKRRIIDEHRLIEASEPKVHPHPNGCETCHFDREYGVYGDGPCATLKLLASVYADHPDYQQEWRP